jgi:hypothetical protein
MFMARFLLEDVWKLALCLGALQFFLVCLWSWTSARRVAVANWVVLALIPILCGLSILITTPAEQIIETCRRVALAIDDGDMQEIASYVSTDFQAGDFDRDTLLEKLERTLTRVRVDKPRLRAFEVTVPSPTIAEAVFRASCRIRTSEFTGNSLPSKWRIHFRLESDAWRMTKIESLPVPPMNFRVLGDWLR